MKTRATFGVSVAAPLTRLAVSEAFSDPLSVVPIPPAPCTAACPAGVNVKAYVSLIAEGRFSDALEEVRRRCTLPSVCGRICHAPCEPACRRAQHDDPLAIRALKRFVSDLASEVPRGPPEPVSRTERVVVIGSGPAGLTAAFDLRRAGFSVTVLEASSEPGGMLRYGVADYRLPPAVLDAEIDAVLAVGIDLATGTPVTDFADVTDLFSSGYSAVLLALGAQNGRVLGLTGEAEVSSVEDALSFLRRVNAGDHTPLSGEVLVVGGGSTAIEAARTAVRVGAGSVTMAYRRTRDELRAGSEEAAQAEDEGVVFRFLAAPNRFVVRDGSLQGLECLQVALGEPDADGRPRPVPIPGSEFLMQANHVLVAVGQVADLDFLNGSAAGSLLERGLIRTDPSTDMTAERGLFAAGDVVSGPTTVIEAIASGHEAAASIISYLETGSPGRGLRAGDPPPELGIEDPEPVEASQIRPVVRGVEAGHEFAEVEQPYTAAEAVAEASRCLRCGPCGECAVCASGCDRRHLFVRFETTGAIATWTPLRVTSDVANKVAANGDLRGQIVGPVERNGSDVDVRPMIMRYSPDLCRGCARCIDVCSFGAVRRDSVAALDAPIQFDATTCRGCALCGAVCPTGALIPAAHSPEWWKAYDPTQTRVTLTCDTGAPAGVAGPDGGTMTCRCVGQAHPGVLLDLFLGGVEHLTVVPCDRCRFESGPRLASQHVAESTALLEALGRVDATVTLAMTVREGV